VPVVRFRGETIECDRGDLLREVLREAGVSPHNAAADRLNCRGLGSCGTCAVAVAGAVDDRSRRERLRLAVPPHDPDDGLRLACQTRVLRDVTVEKHPGFWGQHADEPPVDEGGSEPTESDDTGGVER
jgi:ferredoxin